MRFVFRLTVALSLALATCARPETISLFTDPGHSSSVTVAPGASIDFMMEMDAGTTEISAINYRATLPTTGWELTTRDYSSYGWYAADGVFDASIPEDKSTTSSYTYPVEVTDDLFGSSGSDVDFYFDTGQETGTKTGTFTVETFTLHLPSDIADGQYDIGMAGLYVYDESYDPVATDWGGDFPVDVIPEPGTLATFAIGLIALALIRRRLR